MRGWWDDGENRRYRVQRALDGDAGLELKRLRRGRFPDAYSGDEAEAWARGQPWYPRIVRRQCTPHWWLWRVLAAKPGNATGCPRSRENSPPATGVPADGELGSTGRRTRENEGPALRRRG